MRGIQSSGPREAASEVLSVMLGSKRTGENLMGTETYPVTISQPPAVVAGHRVLAWAETRRRHGEYPGGVVLAVSSPDEHGQRTEYVTWDAYTKDGGQTWHASTGHYITDHAAAWLDFTHRCTGLATEF